MRRNCNRVLSPPREKGLEPTSAGDNRRFVRFKNCVLECLSRSYPGTYITSIDSENLVEKGEEKKRNCREYISYVIKDILRDILHCSCCSLNGKEWKTTRCTQIGVEGVGRGSPTVWSGILAPRFAREGRGGGGMVSWKTTELTGLRICEKYRSSSCSARVKLTRALF